MAIGVAIAAAVRRQIRPAAIGLVAALALVAFSAAAPHGHETGRRIDIAFVQGGGPQGTRAIDTDMRKVFLRHLTASRPSRSALIWCCGRKTSSTPMVR